MKKTKRIFLWYYMLNKRMLHRKEFVLLLCLIPLLVIGMKQIAKEDSGVLTIYLCAESTEDELAKQIISKLFQADSVVRYKIGSAEAAYDAVATGEADCAWVFRDDFESRLDEYAATDAREKEAPIFIVEREDNVALQLARTNLYSVVYDHYVYYLCKNFLQDDIMKEQVVSEDSLLSYFQQTAVEEKLVEIEYVGQQSIQETESYLLHPVRGMLLLLIVVCAMASAIYYLRDEEKGIYEWVPIRKRAYLACGYQLVVVLDVAFIAFLSMCILEGERMDLRDVMLFLLYTVACCSFSNFIMLLCRNIETMGRCIPLLAIAMFAVCPIFLDLGADFWAQYLFPPTYYLRAFYDNAMLFYMLLYVIVFGLGGIIIQKVKYSG